MLIYHDLPDLVAYCTPSCKRRIVYKFINKFPFDNTAIVESWARKPVTDTSWVAVVTETDRPKSIHNRCVIEYFGFSCCLVTFLNFLLV